MRLSVLALATIVAVSAPPRLRAIRQDSAAADTAGVKHGDLPLRTTRTLEFTTSEGTWISVDVSPNGQTIVFDLAGDLYTMPIAGGQATRITSGAAFDGQPRYSPDGRLIAFTSDRDGTEQVWLVEADGSHPRKLSGGTALYASPEWTPDGQYVVVSRGVGAIASRFELQMYHKDGGGGLELTRGNDEMNAMGAAFGPDGRYLYFARRTGGFSYNQVLPTWQIATYDRETGEYFGQTGEWGSAMRPTLSPDGHWMVYASRHQVETGLRVRDLRTGDERWLVMVVQRDDQESRFTRDLMPGMSFTRDNQSVIASWGGKIWRVAITNGQATEIPFTADIALDVGPSVAVTNRISDSAFTLRQVRDLTVSPDGRRAVFSALDALYAVDLTAPDTSMRRLEGAIRVTRDTVLEQMPSFSPDGRWVVYVTWTDLEGAHVYRVRPDGRSRPERLTQQPGFYAFPVFTPDGTRILVVSGPRHQRMNEVGGVGLELAQMAAAGGALTTVGRVNAVSLPHFVTGQDDRIYYHDGGQGIVSFRYDGTDRRQHIQVTGYQQPGTPQPGNASEMLIAPDGRHVLAQVDNQVYLVTVPFLGGAVPRVSINNPATAPVPVRKVTAVAGDFLRWSADGGTAYWTLGRYLFRYHMAIGDSVAQAGRIFDREAVARRAASRGRPADSTAARDSAAADSAAAPQRPPYNAHELEVAITIARDIPRGTVVLRGARIITMNGDEVIEQGDLVVTNNRIERICSGTCANLPAAARVVPLPGATIMPGIIDVHAHPWAPWALHKQEVWNYQANLAYGVTMTHDVQTATTDVLTYGDRVAAGRMLGPRQSFTGPGVFWSDDIDSLPEARDVLRRYSRYYGIAHIKQYMAGTRKQRQWVIMAARELGLMPTTEGGLDFKMNLTLMQDGYAGLEHSLPITPLFSDVVRLAAFSGIAYTPTLLVAYGGPWTENMYYEDPATDLLGDPKLTRFTPRNQLLRRALRRPQWFHRSQYVHDRIAAGAAAIQRAGGITGIGGHGQLEGLGVHWELWAMAEGGLTPMEALRVATINGARALGYQEDLGTLEPGKLADLVILSANPLDNIRNTVNIRSVMMNGRLYDGNTLNQIWPTERVMPRMWWQDQN
ncbi:MAG: amidohydrolase family protein [Gemmatimonadales bacterium]